VEFCSVACTDSVGLPATPPPEPPHLFRAVRCSYCQDQCASLPAAPAVPVSAVRGVAPIGRDALEHGVSKKQGCLVALLGYLGAAAAAVVALGVALLFGRQGGEQPFWVEAIAGLAAVLGTTLSWTRLRRWGAWVLFGAGLLASAPPGYLAVQSIEHPVFPALQLAVFGVFALPSLLMLGCAFALSRSRF
jgi:hypothetical protein